MPLNDQQLTILRAYSEGRTGWRAACNELALVDHRELLDLLQEHDLPLPPEDNAPLDDATVARFQTLLKGDADDER